MCFGKKTSFHWVIVSCSTFQFKFERHDCLQALSVLSQAFTDIESSPGTEYLSKLCPALQGKLKATSLQQLSYLLNGFTAFGHHPGQAYLDETVSLAKDLLLRDSTEL